DFAIHGPQIIRQVGRKAPGTYMKVLALLMPKDVRIETSHEVVGALSDEQLASVISELTERIESRFRGDVDPPPLKWPVSRYVFDIQEDCNGKEAYKPEEIVAKLRQVDVLVSQGQNMVDAIRQIGVSEVTYYRWRQKFGGLKTEQVKRLKDLELENSR